MTDLKKLNKIAKACRKAGILTFECPEFKFTLSPDEPIKITRTEGNKTPDLSPDKFKTDELTEEQLLLYSVQTLSEGLS